MVFALVSVVVNAVLALGLFFLLGKTPAGIAGIAAATSTAAWVNAGLLGFTLFRRDHYRPGPSAVSRLIRVLIASAALGAVLVLAQMYRPMIEAPIAALTEHGAKEIALILTTGVGGLVYLVLLFVTRAVTIGEIKGLLRRDRRA